MLKQIEEAFPQTVQPEKKKPHNKVNVQNNTTQPKPSKSKAPELSASPEDWIEYWSHHKNLIVCGVRSLDDKGKPVGSPNTESTRAHLTINRLSPVISRGEDDRRRAFFEHAVQIFAIPSKYQQMVEQYNLTISDEPSFVALVTDQQTLDSLTVAKHLAANGVTTVDALLFEEFAQSFIQEMVSAMDPPTLCPYYPLFQQIKDITAARAAESNEPSGSNTNDMDMSPGLSSS